MATVSHRLLGTGVASKTQRPRTLKTNRLNADGRLWARFFLWATRHCAR